MLLVPEFKFDIFSVSSFLADTKLSIIFFRDSFLIQDFNNQMTIGKGIQIENLYVLDVHQPSIILSGTIALDIPSLRH